MKALPALANVEVAQLEAERDEAMRLKRPMVGTLEETNREIQRLQKKRWWWSW